MFLILPFGINGTAAIATDFRDTYFKYGIAYDIIGLSIGFSKLVNLSNSNDSFYKTNSFLEFRLLWNWG